MMTISSVNPSLASTIPSSAATQSAASTGSSVFSEIWDTINPLQHIPVISSLYRTVSNTSISPLANIAGSTIYGGPIGGAIAGVEEGARAIGHAIFGDSKIPTATASAAPTPQVQAAKIEPSAGAEIARPAQAQHHHKLHAATKDWLYQNVNNTETAADSTATNTVASNNASSAYKKVQGLTRDWLNPTLIQAQTDQLKTA